MVTRDQTEPTATLPAEPIEPAEREVEEISSLCMNCHETGATRLLLTKIPFFKELVIMSFECPSCGFRNSEIQSAGEIQQRGVRFTFTVSGPADLQRQLVKSDTCVATLPALELEIPAGRGQLTNVEGLLAMVAQDLEVKQPERLEVAKDIHDTVQGVIDGLKEMVDGKRFPFQLTLDDPAGNSSVEPAVSDGGRYVRAEYERSAVQNAHLGLGSGEERNGGDAVEMREEYRATQMFPTMPVVGAEQNYLDADGEIVENQVYTFPSSCPGCTRPCACNMKMVRIPHFDEVVLMSIVCDHCGYRSSEVKSGGAVPEKGRRITLKVRGRQDLSRDILKAETCALKCPELSLTVEPGTLGGRFTTVEGLITQITDDLRQNIYGDEDFTAGDSMPGSQKQQWEEFFGKVEKGLSGEAEFTVIMEDPMAASYVQSLTAPEMDEQLTVEDYERTEEEEEHLGLNDIKTANYNPEIQDVLTKDEGKKENTEAGAEDTNGIDVDEIQRAVQEQLARLGQDNTDDKETKS